MVIAIIGAFEPEIEKYIELYEMKREKDTLFEVYIGKIDNNDLENILVTILNSDVLTEKERELYFND